MEEKELKKLKEKYDLKEEVLLNVLEIQSKINEQDERKLSFDETISFLIEATKFKDMQTWIFGRTLNGEIVSLNNSLTKLFELKTNEDIINSYELNNNKIKIKK